MFLAALGAAGALRAAPERFSLGLEEAIAAATGESGRVKASEQEWEAARSRARGQGGLLLPRFSFEAGYRYVTEVPAIEVSPARPPVTLADNANYSIGPAVNWVIWDFFGIYNAWRAGEAQAQARRAEYDLAVRQGALETSLLYFRIQLAAEQVKLLAEALVVAQEQHKDISRGLTAGSASRLDKLLAHQEVLARLRQLAQARTALGGAINDLAALTGRPAGEDTSFPLDADTARRPIPDVPPATLAVEVDSLAESLDRLGPAAKGEFDAAFPGIAVHANAAEAAARAARSVSASRLPRVAVSGKTSLDYPNGPILEEFNQNMLAISASLPLFEGGRLANERREQKAKEAAARERRTQAEANARRDWRKAQDSLAGLGVQLEIGREAIKETAEAARLTYDAYKDGPGPVDRSPGGQFEAALGPGGSDPGKGGNALATGGAQEPGEGGSGEVKAKRLKWAAAGLAAVLVLGAAFWHFLGREFLYAGTVEVTEVDISARVSSVIERLDVREGEQVEAEQSLLKLACEDIRLAADLAKSNYERARQLAKGGSLSQADFDRAKYQHEDAALKRAWCDVRAPGKGVVLSIYREAGELVGPGTKLMTLGDLSEAWAYIYVAQPVMARIKLGQEVEGILAGD